MYFLTPNELPDLLSSIAQLIWAVVALLVFLLLFMPFIILMKYVKTFQIIDGKLSFNVNKEHQKYTEISKDNIVNENQMKINSLSSEISSIEKRLSYIENSLKNKLDLNEAIPFSYNAQSTIEVDPSRWTKSG